MRLLVFIMAMGVTPGLHAGCGLRRAASDEGDPAPAPPLLMATAATDAAFAACIARVVSDQAARTAWGWSVSHATTPVRPHGSRRNAVDSSHTVNENPPTAGLTDIVRPPPRTPPSSSDRTAPSVADQEWRAAGRYAAARGATTIRADPAHAASFADLARAHYDLLETIAGRRARPNPQLLPALDDRIERLTTSLERAARSTPDLEWHWIARFRATVDQPPPPCAIAPDPPG